MAHNKNRCSILNAAATKSAICRRGFLKQGIVKKVLHVGLQVNFVDCAHKSMARDSNVPKMDVYLNSQKLCILVNLCEFQFYNADIFQYQFQPIMINNI